MLNCKTNAHDDKLSKWLSNKQAELINAIDRTYGWQKINPINENVFYKYPNGAITKVSSVTEFKKLFGFYYYNGLYIDRNIDSEKYFGQKRPRPQTFRSPCQTTVKTYIAYIGPEIGYGLFAQEDILPGSIIEHYAGNVYLDVETQKGIPFGFFYPSLKDTDPALENEPGLILDARHVGNITRFINSSRTAQAANTVTYPQKYNGIVHIVFQSAEFIGKDQQITIWYGEDYWKDVKVDRL